VQQNLTVQARFCDVGIGDGGQAVVVWYQEDGAAYTIWGAAFDPATGWSTPRSLQTETTAGAGWPPRVAVDPRGNALAVFVTFNGVSYDLWAARFTAGEGWTGEVSLESASETVSTPAVAMDGQGGAMVVWEQSNGVAGSAWANHFSPDTGWQGPVLIERDDTGGVGGPQVASDALGDFTAAWLQYDGTFSRTRANRYTAGAGWGTDVALAAGTGDAYGVEVGMNAAGNATAIWTQWDGVQYAVRADQFTPGGGWSGPRLVEGTRGADGPFVSLGADGAAVAAWTEYNETSGAYGIGAARYTAAGGWGTPTSIESASNDASGLHMAGSSAGEAVAVWSRGMGGATSIWASFYRPGSGWTAPVALDGPHPGNAFLPRAGLDSAGNAWVAWVQVGAEGYHVWANHFSAADLTPPALTLDAPSDGSSAVSASVRVAGSTEPGASVAVDGYAAAVSAAGTFAIEVPLTPGTNAITVVATDPSGNEATARVVVTYADPVAALQAQLAATNVNASAAQAGLATAQAQLAQAQADAAAARAASNATQLQLALTQGELGTTQASLNDTRARVGATSAPASDILPLLIGIGAMAVGAGGLVVGLRAGSAISRAGGGSAKPSEERKPPT
jgi:hypothetical protein